MTEITGHCLCGQLSYKASSDPAMTIVCHCDDCQRSSGSAFSVNLAFPKDAVEITGEAKTFNTTGSESGAERDRMFCPECGSQTFTHLKDMPDLMIVKAGTVDDKSIVQPQMEIWRDSGQPWPDAGERNVFPTGMRG
jgi:hypothetical protein